MDNYIDFPQNSKVWIYQAEHELTDSMVEDLNQLIAHFVEDWVSHGSVLKSRFEIRYNRFILFMVDEQNDNMCGRAIDSSVNFMKEVEKGFEMSFIDRMQVAYRDKGGEIQTVHMNNLKELVEKGEITPETTVFNNTITTKEELETKWEVPIANSWHEMLLHR